MRHIRYYLEFDHGQKSEKPSEGKKTIRQIWLGIVALTLAKVVRRTKQKAEIETVKYLYFSQTPGIQYSNVDLLIVLLEGSCVTIAYGICLQLSRTYINYLNLFMVPIEDATKFQIQAHYHIVQPLLFIVQVPINWVMTVDLSKNGWCSRKLCDRVEVKIFIFTFRTFLKSKKRHTFWQQYELSDSK